MDNLTHSLVGLTAAKAGLERLSPGATFLCVIAANSPDVDVAILLFGDRWTYLQHHRGITHAIVGVVALAVLLPLIFHGVDRLWSAYRKQPVTTKLRGLMIASFIVTATHPILDWTNNYGIRFLLPWSGKWFYGDLVFIIDPLLWLALGGAGFLLQAFEHARRRRPRALAKARGFEPVGDAYGIRRVGWAFNRLAADFSAASVAAFLCAALGAHRRFCGERGYWLDFWPVAGMESSAARSD